MVFYLQSSASSYLGVCTDTKLLAEDIFFAKTHEIISDPYQFDELKIN